MLFLLGLTAFWLHFASCQYNVYRQDPFAILSRTLLTYQEAACDGQVLDLVCPSGTKISIQLVQYGRTAPSSQVKFSIQYYILSFWTHEHIVIQLKRIQKVSPTKDCRDGTEAMLHLRAK